MGLKKVIILVDDLDGSSLAGGTVPFSFDGQDYEIDLSPLHRLELEKALRPYIESARKVSLSARKPDKNRKRPRTDTVAPKTFAALVLPASSSTIRRWAEANNMAIKKGKPTPIEVKKAFYEANHGISTIPASGKPKTRPQRPLGPAGHSTTSQKDIRTWAREQDYHVKQRGRIPRAISELYYAAHPIRLKK